jgi:hypothetical protein
MRRTVALLALAALVLGAGCAAVPGLGADAPERPNETYLTYEGSNLTLDAAPDQRITGHVNESRSVGNVTVRVRSSESANPFLRSIDANVSEDGRFGAPVNLSNVEGDTAFTVTVLKNDTELLSADGRVAA